MCPCIVNIYYIVKYSEDGCYVPLLTLYLGEGEIRSFIFENVGSWFGCGGIRAYLTVRNSIIS